MRALRASAFAVVIITGFLLGDWYARRWIVEPDLPGFPRLSPPDSGATTGSSQLWRVAKTSGAVAKRDFAVLSRRPLDYGGIETFLGKLAATDPQAALEAVFDLPVRLQGHAIEIVLAVWLKARPDEAWEFIVQNYADFLTSKDFMRAAIGAGRPDLAVAAVNRLTDPMLRRLTATSLFPIWANEDPAGFATWTGQLPESVKGIAHAASAAQGIAARTLAPGALTDLLGTDAGAWASAVDMLMQSRSYEQTKAYFASLPSAPHLDQAYARLAQSAPPEESGNWLEKIIDQTTRMRAASMDSILALANGAPEVAAKLAIDPAILNAVAAGLTSPDGTTIHPNRDGVVTLLANAARAWAIKDEAAAIAFVRAAPLSEAEKAKVLSAIAASVPPHS